MLNLQLGRLVELAENLLIVAGALALLYLFVGFPLAMWWHIYRAPVSRDQNPFDLLNLLDPMRG